MTYFRIYHETAGGHVRTRWFAGKNRNAEATMACCGDLMFTEEEWEALSYTLQLNSRVRLIDETARGSGGKARPTGPGEPGPAPPDLPGAA